MNSTFLLRSCVWFSGSSVCVSLNENPLCSCHAFCVSGIVTSGDETSADGESLSAMGRAPRCTETENGNEKGTSGGERTHEDAVAAGVAAAAEGRAETESRDEVSHDHDTHLKQCSNSPNSPVIKAQRVRQITAVSLRSRFNDTVMLLVLKRNTILLNVKAINSVYCLLLCVCLL